MDNQSSAFETRAPTEWVLTPPMPRPIHEEQIAEEQKEEEYSRSGSESDF